jgi:hypothetical protein
MTKADADFHSWVEALYVVLTIDKKGRKMTHYFVNYDAAETAHREFRNHPLCENSEFDRPGYTLNKTAQSAIDTFEIFSA